MTDTTDTVSQEAMLEIAGASTLPNKFLAWMEACWPHETGSDFNQGVIRGFEIIKAQVENGHTPLTTDGANTASDDAVRLLREARKMIRRSAHFSGATLIADIDALLGEGGAG